MSHARKEYKDFMALAPDAYEVVLALGKVAAAAGIDKQLLELIKLRASQINGCAFCVQYHILQSESLGMSGRQAQSGRGVARGPAILSPRARRTGLDGSADIAR